MGKISVHSEVLMAKIKSKMRFKSEILKKIDRALFEPDLKTQLRTKKIGQILESETRKLRKLYLSPKNHPNDWFLMESQKSRISFATAIDFLAEAACHYLNGTLESFRFIKTRNWENMKLDEKGVGLRSLRDDPEPITFQLSRKKVERFILLAARLSQNLRSNVFQTKRKMYYMDKDNYGKNQSVMDDLLEELAATLATPRASFHVLASSRGLACGDLSMKICTQDDETGARRMILQETKNFQDQLLSIQNPAAIVDLSSSAKFCLVIEKEAIFNDMVQAGVHKKLNCLLVTGKGFPDTMTRHFTHLIWCFLRIPIFCLVDGDPRGIEIMCTYRFGSLSAAYDHENLSVPQMRWLGIYPSDLEHPSYRRCFQCDDSSDEEEEPTDSQAAYDEDDSCSNYSDTSDSSHSSSSSVGCKSNRSSLGDRLTGNEVKSLKALLQRPYLEKAQGLAREIEYMLKSRRKFGLETLSQAGHSWLWEWYIPMKLHEIGDDKGVPI